MNVNVVLVVIAQINAQRLGLAAQVAHRGLRAFFHHVTKGTSKEQAAFAGHSRGFDKQNLPANWRPGEAGRDSKFFDGFGSLVGEASRHPQRE